MATNSKTKQSYELEDGAMFVYYTPKPGEDDLYPSNAFQAQNASNPAEEDDINPIYRNVLTFPQDAEFIKHFDQIPHRDRISEQLLGLVEQLFPYDLNVHNAQKKLDFEWVKRELASKLSEMDKKLLYLPDKVQQWINTARDEDYRTAFTHLRDCFYNYFSTPVNGNVLPAIQWIDYAFAAKYPPAQKALQDLKANLFNEKAVVKLLEKLREAKVFGDRRTDFYFWNTSPYNWSDISYKARSVKNFSKEFLKSFTTISWPPQYWALGDFTINAIPEGYVVPKNNGAYDVCVNKIYLFVNDSFNFEDNACLGPWILDPEPEFSEVPGLVILNNADFREFQRHGYGRYFPVLSKLHELENFTPMCLENVYVK